MKAADLGVGDGVNAIYLAQNGYHVYGVDISRVAISKARQKFIDANQSGNLEIKDLKEVELDEGSYDLVICSMVAHYLERLEVIRLVEKIKRSLAVGGLVLFVTLSTDDPQCTGKRLNDISQHIKTFMTKAEVLKLFGDFSLLKLTDSLSAVDLNVATDRSTGEILIMGDIAYLGRKND